MTPTKQHQQEAFTHAQAYAVELTEDFANADDLEQAISRTRTIGGLTRLLKGNLRGRTHHYTVSSLRKNVEPIQRFYEAMLKLVPHLEYPQHSGTECRGWYRVWGAIVENDDYFCSYDAGRDANMAYLFYEYGAISDSQYRQHRVVFTLKLAACRRFMTDGRPDPHKMRQYWDDDWANRLLDPATMWALERAADPHTETLAILSF